MKFLKLFSLMAFLAVGMLACNTAPDGETADTGEAGDAATASGEAVTYNVDLASSAVNWVGSKPSGQHTGTISLKEGNISVKDGNIEAGKFVLDMTSINVTDLEGDEKAGLEGHLTGATEENADHFFNVKKFPSATFEVVSAEKLEGDSLMTHSITGNLSMKDSIHSITFKANVNVGDNGVTAESNNFNIDRTKWSVNYGSKNVFKNLGDKFINDEIGLQIRLVGNAPAADAGTTPEGETSEGGSTGNEG